MGLEISSELPWHYQQQKLVRKWTRFAILWFALMALMILLILGLITAMNGAGYSGILMVLMIPLIAIMAVVFAVMAIISLRTRRTVSRATSEETYKKANERSSRAINIFLIVLGVIILLLFL